MRAATGLSPFFFTNTIKRNSASIIYDVGTSSVSRSYTYPEL
jgi:hypothetical protein